MTIEASAENIGQIPGKQDDLIQNQVIRDKSIEERDDLSETSLQSILPEQFLNISKDLRLQYVTEPRVKSSELLDRSKNQIKINFSYNGELNKDLYLNVTAGQILPDKIDTIEKQGIKYIRKGIEGEFYDSDNNRLVIHEDDTLKIPNLITNQKYISSIEKYDNQYNEFIKNNPEYQDEKFKTLILEVLKRNIEPKFALLVLKGRIENFVNEIESNTFTNEIESILIDLGRSFNGVSLAYSNSGKYSIESAVKLSHYLFPANVEKILKKYGYTDDEIKKTISKNPDPINNKVDRNDGLENYFAPAEYYSFGIEYTDSGETACARTAFKNLKRFGVPVRDTKEFRTDDLHHAHVLLEKYKKQGKIQHFPPENGYNYADLYLDASKNIYKHRVACYRSKVDNNWYVLDPYYKIDLKNRSRKDPIPWEQYKNFMKGRKFYGAVLYN